MPENFKNIVEVSFRLVFTPRGFAALVAAISLLTAALFDVEWGRVFALLAFTLFITFNLSPVPTVTPETHANVVFDYGRAGETFPERRLPWAC